MLIFRRRWSPMLRLSAALVTALAVVALLEGIPSLRTALLPLNEFTAATAFLAVERVGLPIALDHVMLTHPSGFRFAISYGCTPFVPSVFLICVLTIGLALSWRQRLIGVFGGIAVLTLVNLFRVIALYYIGTSAPGAFAIAHEWLGQSLIVLATAIIAVYWIGAARRPLQMA